MFILVVTGEKRAWMAIMLGLSLVRLLGVKPSQHGWCAGHGLTQPAPHPSGRDSVVETLVAESWACELPPRSAAAPSSIAGSAAFTIHLTLVYGSKVSILL